MSTLHHLEILVKDGLRFARQISAQYSFAVKGFRESGCATQWLLQSGSASFLVTQPNIVDFECIRSKHPNLNGQSPKFLRGVDTFFDVAIRVKDVDRVLRQLSAVGGDVLQEKMKVHDAYGSCEVAVIKSCVGNVVHTLIDREQYAGTFLPGFSSVVSQVPPHSHVRHIDHITLVCERGKVDEVLRWYERVFGFSRFLMNRSEQEKEGFVLDDDIGLRLKAMEYFHCSETMLSSDLDDAEGLRLVIAESLPGHDAQTNQVESFLAEHEGPGLQHVGLYTDDIVRTTSTLRDRGVKLQVPPLMYYSHPRWEWVRDHRATAAPGFLDAVKLGKLKEIKDSGEDLSLLRENGILIDSEADPNVDADNTRRYLKQIFTKPIFDKQTVFLELIERQGASGFGTGNIAALWWSVQQSLNSKSLACR